MKNITLFFVLLTAILISGCGKSEEYSMEQIKQMKAGSKSDLLAKTVSKPGGQPFEIGKSGGVYNSSILGDPKTFNTLTARDSESRAAIDLLYDYLADYDPYKKEFVPELADFKIDTDEKNDKMTVTFTLRDDLYWTTSDGKIKVKVTSDDAVYWYNEIAGDKDLALPDYSGQFIKMKDGKDVHVDIEKIDDRSFAFHYPRIVANPIYTANMSFGPKFVFEKAKKSGGEKALKNLYTVDTDVKTIVSVGRYHIIEYTPGVRIVMKHNPNFWKKDDKGTPIPYIDKVIFKITPDINTEYLLFKKGDKDSYTVIPENLDALLKQEKPDYTVYNGGPSQSSDFLMFNQNPDRLDKKVYSWFKETKFRQAMSCMLNRQRIIQQVFRGLAEPAMGFFSKSNPLYDEKIVQKYSYNPQRAIELLSEIGIKRGKDGVMKDRDGNPIVFELAVNPENTIRLDEANIFSDELSKIGITVKVKAVDFQKIVDMLLNTYDWQANINGLGAIDFPTSGINVWLSSGNFHFWHPLQKKPATDWEARVDYLFNEGSFTIDKTKAKKIWDEYQRILLDQCPFIYIAHRLAFEAVNNKWSNVYFDTLNGGDFDSLNGVEADHLYLKEK